MNSRTKYSVIIAVALIWTGICGYCLSSGFYSFTEPFYPPSTSMKRLLDLDLSGKLPEMWFTRWGIGLAVMLFPLVRIKTDKQ